jgi:hypothetical protein
VTPGPVATLALLLVIPGTIVAFSYLSATRALLAVLFAGILFLPELVNFDAPGVPPMDKQSIPSICLTLAVLVSARKKFWAAKPGRGLDLFMVVAVLSPIATVLLNQDPIVYGTVIIPGHLPGDAISESIVLLFRMAIPFVLGRALIRTSADARDLLRAFLFGGLAMVPFILIELRLSPQFHNWVYGFGQHSFAQTVRGSGYRPMVFMSHGLALAIFMFGSVCAAWTLARSNVTFFGQSVRPMAWVLTVLFPFIKSVAAIVYAAVAVPIGARSPRAQAKLCAVLIGIAALYPALRSEPMEIFPTKMLSELSASFSDDRAHSLGFRFMMEDRVLAHTFERPWFGWGVLGRNQVYTRDGVDITIIDGAWLILLSCYGFVGLIATMGVIIVSIAAALRNLRRVAPADQPLLMGIALIASFGTVDLLPNGMYNTLPMFLAGACAGLAQGMPLEQKGGLHPVLVARLRQLVQRLAATNALPSWRAR